MEENRDTIGSSPIQNQENQKKRTEIWPLSNFDPLTGIMPLGRFIESALNCLKEYPDRSYVLVCYHLEDLSSVNEDYGFGVGNQLIQQFAYYLRAYLGELSQIGHASAHTFVELRELVVGIDEEGESLVQRAVTFCDLQEHRYGILNIGIKIGLCMIRDAQNDLYRAVEGAGAACSAIKSLHGCAYRVYDESLDEKIYQEIKIRSRMRSALRNDEFMVFYQPKFDLMTGRMVGMEALARWKQSDGTLVAPDKFIPVFEKNGFIEQLDEYVLHRVLEDLSVWQSKGKRIVSVSINLSGWSVKRAAFIQKLITIIRERGTDPSLIEFELTETVCGESLEQTIEVLERLKREGFGIALDDFGSGYAALGMLPSIPADVIKIDKTLLDSSQEDEKKKVLLESVIHMLKKMDFTVLCEGIEEQSQWDMLLSMGCELGQGYYFSRPVPAESVEVFMESEESH